MRRWKKQEDNELSKPEKVDHYKGREGLWTGLVEIRAPVVAFID